MRGKSSPAAFFIEGLNAVTLKNDDAVLNWWKEYFSDLLYPVDATSTQIHEEQVGEDIQITEADVNAVIKSLKIEKGPGENDIKPGAVYCSTFVHLTQRVNLINEQS